MESQKATVLESPKSFLYKALSTKQVVVEEKEEEEEEKEEEEKLVLLMVLLRLWHISYNYYRDGQDASSCICAIC